jgi:holo-[acyl-carrier protein] synthase
VLRPGDEAVPWSTIEILRGAGGAVEIALTDAAATLADAAELRQFAVSLTHDAGFAAAVVVALDLDGTAMTSSIASD